MLVFGWGSFNFFALLIPALLVLALFRLGMAILRHMHPPPDDGSININTRIGDSVVPGRMRTEVPLAMGDELHRYFGRRSLDSRIFQLAYRNGRRVTVSQVVVDAGMSLNDTEEYLDRLCHGVRVRMEVSNTGLVIYEFPELVEYIQRGGRRLVS